MYSAESEYSHVLDLYKHMETTTDLVPDVYYVNETNSNVLDKTTKNKSKKDKVTVNALKINEKTLIIKGYNETLDKDLLNTINLDIKNIEENKTSSEVDNNSLNMDVVYNTDVITPITIDVLLDDEITQLSDNDGDIIEYEVVSGDNLSSIAQKFNITVDTILWANDLNSKSSIKIGQKLVILPVSGISYKVKSGDTISGLANRFKVSERDIVDFNKTPENKLVVGETIIIPGAKVNVQSKPNNSNNSSSGSGSSNSNNTNTGSMAKPIGAGSVKTQGIHGHNGVDFGAPIGTPVYAALDGVVTLVRNDGGWNGGYGNYIVIKHSNGVQTLYAHLNTVSVNKGESVGRGEMIARSGNTGRSTGPHLHFEVRGARNPF